MNWWFQVWLGSARICYHEACYFEEVFTKSLYKKHIRILNELLPSEGKQPVDEDFTKVLHKKGNANKDEERNVLKKTKEIKNLFDIEDSIAVYQRSRVTIKRKLKKGENITNLRKKKVIIYFKAYKDWSTLIILLE